MHKIGKLRIKFDTKRIDNTFSQLYTTLNAAGDDIYSLDQKCYLPCRKKAISQGGKVGLLK